MAPYEIALLIGGFLPCAAWLGHTAASKAFAEDIEQARKLCGMSQKELAIEMGLTPEQLNRQLAGLEPLNAWRLFGLTNAEFRAELLEQQLNRTGASVQQRMDAVIARLDFLLGNGPLPMMKATLRPQGQKAQAS